MADTMQFDLVSPERRLASGQAKSVQIPGAEGQLTAMPDHAPMITTLRPGIIRVEMADGVKSFGVIGGFAEITGDSVSILAERAYADGQANHAEVMALLEEARTKAAGATPEHRDIAELLVADLVELASNMASDRNLAQGGAPAPA
jgi:F-type H+-transporting ATPase subunit epsilon